MKFDENNLIVQLNGDGGDTAQRMGLYFSLLRMRDILGISNNNFIYSSTIDYINAIKLLQVESGIWRRHPTQWNSPKDFSRDQTISNVVAMGFCGLRNDLRNLFLAFKKRKFLFFQNNDIMTPTFVGAFIRSYYWSNNGFMIVLFSLILWPILFWLDLCLVVEALIRCYKKGNDFDNVGDDLNTSLIILQAQFILPTPFAWFSAFIYSWLPLGVNHSFEWYFRPESGGNKEFVELARPLINKYF